VQASALFIYPTWWISANAERLARDEEASLAAFPGAEIVGSRIDAILAFDRTRQLGQIRTPTLVVGAMDDQLTPPYFSEALARSIPGAALALLERGGHAVSQIAPEEWNRMVLEFLQAH
jgi:aminoacrylate hydrolase